MSWSSEASGAGEELASDLSVLRGPEAGAARTARLDADLRLSPWAQRYGMDPRLVDPALEAAFDEVAAQVREAARAAGYADGWAAGRAAGEQEAARVAAEAERVWAARRAALEERARQVFARLAAAADALEQTMAPAADQATDLGLRLGVELAEILVGHELTVAADPGWDAVRRAVALAPAGRSVTARLHPDDFAALLAHHQPGDPPQSTQPTQPTQSTRDAQPTQPTGGARDATAEARTPTEAASWAAGDGGDRPVDLVVRGRLVRCLPDETVEPGGAVLDCDATRIDAQIGPALARVRALLAANVSSDLGPGDDLGAGVDDER